MADEEGESREVNIATTRTDAVIAPRKRGRPPKSGRSNGDGPPRKRGRPLSAANTKSVASNVKLHPRKRGRPPKSKSTDKTLRRKSLPSQARTWIHHFETTIFKKSRLLKTQRTLSDEQKSHKTPRPLKAAYALSSTIQSNIPLGQRAQPSKAPSQATPKRSKPSLPEWMDLLPEELCQVVDATHVEEHHHSQTPCPVYAVTYTEQVAWQSRDAYTLAEQGVYIFVDGIYSSACAANVAALNGATMRGAMGGGPNDLSEAGRFHGDWHIDKNGCLKARYDAGIYRTGGGGGPCYGVQVQKHKLQA
ncbi:hypothetical protein H2200_010721 [Cladophialophora chaetospira]|uniref:Uncharacterized protein n=1 Tax=Cladophialophora chaetospira TaxID=386627 RepID=A0AA38X0S4_9EURO|nr:hypothetical protein H2200_010721 [Cladophialophora chaetospira]